MEPPAAGYGSKTNVRGVLDRPKYDDYGEAWILCKGTDGWEIADDVSERYFFGDIESISSKLASEPALRTHLLSIISTGGFTTPWRYRRFFGINISRV